MSPWMPALREASARTFRTRRLAWVVAAGAVVALLFVCLPEAFVFIIGPGSAAPVPVPDFLVLCLFNVALCVGGAVLVAFGSSFLVRLFRADKG